MTIRSNVSLGAIQIPYNKDTQLTSTVLPVTRTAISAFSIFNYGDGDSRISIFLSPSSLSSEGKLVGEYNIKAHQSVQVEELVGQGLNSNENIIAIAGRVGLIAKISRTEYE